MAYINGAASDPLRLLDSQLSGYLLAIAIAAVLPALRLALDRAVLSVLPQYTSVLIITKSVILWQFVYICVRQYC